MIFPKLTCMKTSIRSLAIIALTITGFAFSPKALAVVPPPDGGYPGGNTAEGQAALLSLISGTFNTAVGFLSLRSITDGQFCTGVGAGTLLANTADGNTATGTVALLSNTNGISNTANGAFSLFSNTVGGDNTANGYQALFSNSAGFDNTADGFQALFSNTTGQANTATGEFALAGNTSGGFNTAVGEDALVKNTTGIGNIALGAEAGANLTTGNSNIDIGNFGVAGESNTIRIGGQELHTATFIAGITGVDEGSPTTVFINTTTGQLGTTPPASSQRFKKEIKPMDKASEGILELKPVTFQYKNDKTDTPQFGLVAEEVAKVNPALVLPDKEGRPYTVRYDAVNAMLLNEFLKEHRRVEELKSAMAQQRKDFETAIVRQQKVTEALVARLNEHEARIQKVSAQVEIGKSEAEILVENR
jgi:Chaperone of endosialidase